LMITMKINLVRDFSVLSFNVQGLWFRVFKQSTLRARDSVQPFNRMAQLWLRGNAKSAEPALVCSLFAAYCNVGRSEQRAKHRVNVGRSKQRKRLALPHNQRKASL